MNENSEPTLVSFSNFNKTFLLNLKYFIIKSIFNFQLSLFHTSISVLSTSSKLKVPNIFLKDCAILFMKNFGLIKQKMSMRSLILSFQFAVCITTFLKIKYVPYTYYGYDEKLKDRLRLLLLDEECKLLFIFNVRKDH